MKHDDGNVSQVQHHPQKLTSEKLGELAREAWKVRDNAYILGDTRVGAAVLGRNGEIFVGCNVEHRFRAHDVHAEVNAVSSMVAGGVTKVVAVIVVAEREMFTPCGGCLDWIFQFGGGDCIVGYQSRPDGDIKTFRAAELMPYYPR